MDRKWCEVLDRVKPVILMVVIQAVGAGVNIFYKLAVSDGMSMRILITYRFLFATAFLTPLAFILERKNRPKLTWTVAFQGFLSGLFGGSLAQNLFIESLALTSATFAAAMANLIPAVTFILAIIFRLETLGIRTLAGIAKVMGTLAGIGGAMTLTFYKGREIKLWHWNIAINLTYHHHNHPVTSHQALGSLMALASCVCFAIWMIIQAKMSKKYPYVFSSTALMSGTASIQGAVYAMCMERDWSAWKLGWNIRLLAAVYTGPFANGVMITVITWCVRKRGPLFASSFSPLLLVYVALFGSLILAEKLHVGSFIGSVTIIVGLYMVLWGKGEEAKGGEAEDAEIKSKSGSESQDIQVMIASSSGAGSSAVDFPQQRLLRVKTASFSPENGVVFTMDHSQQNLLRVIRSRHPSPSSSSSSNTATVTPISLD